MVGESDVVIRKAQVTDLELVFQWRNLKEIVALSQLQKTVTRDEHCKWFQDSISSSQHSIFIISSQDREVGLCRFEHAGRVCELSIYLLPGHTQKGVGSIALDRKSTRLNSSH